MNPSTVDKIADAVLYEGYILYPYRASSRKNRQRFTFGRVYPEAYSKAQSDAEPFLMQTECLLQAQAKTPTLEVRPTKDSSWAIRRLWRARIHGQRLGGTRFGERGKL